MQQHNKGTFALHDVVHTYTISDNVLVLPGLCCCHRIPLQPCIGRIQRLINHFVIGIPQAFVLKAHLVG